MGNCSCTHSRNKLPNGVDLGNIYVEYKGELTDNPQSYEIHRQLFSTKTTGQVAMLTRITGKIKLTGHINYSFREIYEYFVSDSMFSFDVSDSTYIAVSLKDIENITFEELTFSSLWLLNNYNSTISNEKPDTSTIAGCFCQKMNEKDYSRWFFGNIPMAISKMKSGLIYHETAVKFISDTIVEAAVFQQPKGFHQILATKNKAQFAL